MWRPVVRGPSSQAHRGHGKKLINNRSYKSQKSPFSSPTSIQLLNRLSNHILTRLYMRLPPSSNDPDHSDTDTQLLDRTEQTTAEFNPAFFGHPHDKAELQATEPFWHQHPYWSQPGNQLYYYPELNSFFDHPLYIGYTMDCKPVIIGYGKNSRFAKQLEPVHNTAAPKRRHVDKVEVYVADEFVQQVPLKLLLRFSGVAKTKFGVGPGQNDRHDSMNVKAPGPTSSKLDWADEINAASEGAPQPSLTKESITPAANGKSNAKQPSASTQFDRKGVHDWRLDLTIDGIDEDNMPSLEAIQTAITWMQDNGGEKEYDKMLDYAPPVLDDISFLTLVDFYQASLAFDLQPYGKIRRLRHELMDRITTMIIDLETLEIVAQFIPVHDTIMARAITRAHECWGDRQYNANEWLAIKGFLLQNANPALQKKARGIIRSRQKSYAEERRKHQEAHEGGRRQQCAEASRQQDWRSANGVPNETVDVETASATENQISQNADGTGGRRRNRRGQQRRSQGIDGKEVPGASYA